jgi:hypothetical protein
MFLRSISKPFSLSDSAIWMVLTDPNIFPDVLVFAPTTILMPSSLQAILCSGFDLLLLMCPLPQVFGMHFFAEGDAASKPFGIRKFLP